MQSLFHYLAKFMPPASAVDRFERMRSTVGALFGLVIAGAGSFLLLGDSPAAIWLVAPMGASAVLLFAVPASPLAQPWSIMGGNVIAALIGVTCAKLIGAPILAAGIAGALAIAAMFALRCLHPPSGAVALTAVLGGPAVHAMGYGFVLTPVAVNSFLLLLTALFFNNVTGRRYPHVAVMETVQQHETNDVTPTARLGVTTEDLDTVLARYNQVLDISRDDLEKILQDTERQVYLRRFGVTRCGDVMSRDVVHVEFSTELQIAWQLLQQHHLKVLPVLDRARRVIGMIDSTDILRHAQANDISRLSVRLKQFLRPSYHSHSIKPEVVGQIMQKNMLLASEDQPVTDLVKPMSDGAVHSVAVIDATRRLVGVLTQSDMIAALYETNLQSVSTPQVAPFGVKAG
jgi:CBS domain-containing membrane protein